MNNYRKRRVAGHDILAVFLYIAGAAALVGIDQILKLWAVNVLKPKGSMPVIGEYVKFTFAANSGAAFSILQGQRFLLVAIPAFLSLACIMVIVSRKLESVLGDVALMLIVAGGIGNLIDRVRQGFVIDFIDFNMIHFAIFNFADSCVTIGVILLVLYVILREGNFGRRKQKSGIFTRRRF